MRYALTFLFLFVFLLGFYAGAEAQTDVCGSDKRVTEGIEAKADKDRFYGKYATDEPAVLTEIPRPLLTPEAVRFFKPDEMVVEAVLRRDGTVSNIVFRGFLRNGMGDRVETAVRKIKFKPAKVGGCFVSQKVTLKYGIKRCRNGKVCNYAKEVVE